MSNIAVEAGIASNKYELNNSQLKTKYIKLNIDIINLVMSMAPGYCGSFGTGYPFYALDNSLSGTLPFIQEQIRYNDELISEASSSCKWPCEDCLAKNGCDMPDLKSICKPCLSIKDSIKPRKVINRLPDVDMWMICDDDKLEDAKETLVKTFNGLSMHTSDIDPSKTILEVIDIANDIEAGVIPSKMLPLDIHIIPKSQFYGLLDQIPSEILSAVVNEKTPYLPIHPISLRKSWQYDDEPYNFTLDYLLSLTPFNWTKELNDKYNKSRKAVIYGIGEDALKDVLRRVSPDSVKRRMETNELQKRYERRIESWKTS